MAGKELKKILMLVAISLALITLQTTWLPRHALFGARPDLMLILICCLGLSRGITSSLPAALATGVMYGALNQQFLMTVILWTVIGAVTGLSNNNIFISSRPLAGLIAGAGTILSFFLYWIFAALFLKEPFYTAWETPIIAMLMNATLAYIIYPFFPAKDAHPHTYE
jgi:hypothetical protein